MPKARFPWTPGLVAVAVAAACLGLSADGGPGQADAQRPVFRGGVDLVNVSATVTDPRGHFVEDLRKDDFVLHEDGQPLPIAQFTSERVPVSLGIVLDGSSSMAGERIAQARRALEELIDRLPDPEDEVFLYQFDEEPRLLQSWTTRRDVVRRALREVSPSGRTALYDAVSQAVTMANGGRHRKKVLVVISDGNDTASRTSVAAVKRQIQESEVLVYAIGVDARRVSFDTPSPAWFSPQRRFPQRPRPPFPIPIPLPGRPGRPGDRGPLPIPPAPPRSPVPFYEDDPVDAGALRSLTDDSGGRTEIIRSARDLVPATAGIADELNRQYYLAYVSAAPRDGKWHTIELGVSDPTLRVRARRGYLATPVTPAGPS